MRRADLPVLGASALLIVAFADWLYRWGIKKRRSGLCGSSLVPVERHQSDNAERQRRHV
jgi:hypothetical protein